MLKKAVIMVLFGPGCIFAQGTPKPTPSAQVQSSGKTQRLHPAPPGKASSIASSSKTVEGPPKRLTIKEAESIALRNSPVLGSAYFNAQAAKDVVKEVRSQFFPQVQGIIEAVGTSNAIRNAFAGTNHTAPQIRIGASGALNNSLILSREAQGFNISQLIFDFGRTANLAAAAQFDALSQAQKAQLVRAQVVYRVDRAYLNVLKAKAMLNVAQQTVTNRQVILDEITALFQNKLKSDLDLTLAQANLDQAQQLVLQTQNAVGAALAELSAALGYKKEYRDELTALALRVRPDVIAMRDQVLSAQRKTVAERDARLPSVEALGALGRTPIGDPGVEGNYLGAGVVVQIPVFTGGLLSARQDEALLRANAAQKSLDDTETEAVSAGHST